MQKPKRRFMEKPQQQPIISQNHLYQSLFTLFQRSLQIVIDDCFSFIGSTNQKTQYYSTLAADILIRFFEREFPYNQLQFYGSRQLGISTEQSDVNVMLEPVSKDDQNILQEVVKRMAEYGFCHQSFMLNSYTLEIVVDPLYQSKHHKHYNLYPIPIILMFNPYYKQNFNLKSSIIISDFLSEKNNFKVVLIVLKKIMVDANLFNRYDGGINLYCLFLMLASFVRYYKIPSNTGSGSIFKQMVKFYAEVFNPENTVIYFNETEPCFIPISQFKKTIDPIKTIFKFQGKEKVVDLVRPLYIYDSTQKKMLEYSFSKAPLVFNLFGQISQLINNLENTQVNVYQRVCANYNYYPNRPFDESFLMTMLQESCHILRGFSNVLYSLGFMASKMVFVGNN